MRVAYTIRYYAGVLPVALERPSGFRKYWNHAQITADPFAKGNLLKKAMDMNKHDPVPTYADEHWCIPTVAHYWLIYAMQHLGTPEIARKQIQGAKHLLSKEYHNDFLKRLGRSNPPK